MIDGKTAMIEQRNIDGADLEERRLTKVADAAIVKVNCKSLGYRRHIARHRNRRTEGLVDLTAESDR